MLGHAGLEASDHSHRHGHGEGEDTGGFHGVLCEFCFRDAIELMVWFLGFCWGLLLLRGEAGGRGSRICRESRGS